ncbi:hypothetical protein LMIY3S_05076 [Labrys miyagiensis]
MEPTNSNNADTAIKTILSINDKVHAALSKEASKFGREPNEYMQSVLTEHVMRQKLLAATDHKIMQAYLDCVAFAVKVAMRQAFEGKKINPAITQSVAHECAADKVFREKYELYVGGDMFRHGNPRKGTINREIGFRIRAAINGIVKKDANGKAATVKCNGEFIQSYTPMESYDIGGAST